MNEYVNAIYNQRNPNALKELLEKKKKDLDEALLTVITDMDMATDEKTACAKVLLHAGANPDTMTSAKCRLRETALIQSISYRVPEIADLLIEFKANVNATDSRGDTALHHSVRDGQAEVTLKLLAAGADPNMKGQNGNPPLFLALTNDDWEIMEMLLKATDLTLKNDMGRDALHTAVRCWNDCLGRSILDWLIKAGVDLEVRCRDYTPLTAAVECANVNAVQKLLSAGCDVNAPVARGQTALNVAATAGSCNIALRAGILAALLKAGANVDGNESADESPLESAIYNCNILAIRQLLQANCTGRIKPFGDDESVGGFIDIALLKDAEDCVSFILADSCAKEDQLDDSVLSQFFSFPIPLAKMCRLIIRSALPKGPLFLSAVDQLPLPRALRDFIALRPTRKQTEGHNSTCLSAVRRKHPAH